MVDEFNKHFTQEEKIKFLKKNGWAIDKMYVFDYSCDSYDQILIPEDEIKKVLKKQVPEVYALQEGADEWVSLEEAFEWEVDYFLDDLLMNKYTDVSDELLIEEIKKVLKK